MCEVLFHSRVTDHLLRANANSFSLRSLNPRICFHSHSPIPGQRRPGACPDSTNTGHDFHIKIMSHAALFSFLFFMHEALQWEIQPGFGQCWNANGPQGITTRNVKQNTASGLLHLIGCFIIVLSARCNANLE